MKAIVFASWLTFAVNLISYGTTLSIGSGKTYASPAQAAAVAKPGDTLLIHPGNYQGPYFINDLHGTAKAWIVITGVNQHTVILNAGSEGFHFSDIRYVKIQDMTFTGQTGNGMNIDDGGTMDTPAKNILVANCIFKYMGAQGNNDFLKLSGLDSFEISRCTFMKGAAGGSGIDMVGCHYGRVHHCLFDTLGSNCIQMKGGTQYIKIENNIFRNGGQRSLNIGGSTGLAFFRPQDAKFEAADIQVYANVFIRGMAPVAFVGSERADVANNTIYMPEKWVIRILQETVDTSRFVPCRNGMFRNNIIYFSNVVSTHVNIGSNTSPGTFLFSNNLWYNSSDPSASTPNLPATETAAITGQDPLFTATENFILKQSSPAIGSGISIVGLPEDMQGFGFKNPPSRGAYEYGSGVSVKYESKNSAFIIYPNPATSSFCVQNNNTTLSCRIINAQGQTLKTEEIDNIDNCVLIDHIPAGIYKVILSSADGKITSESLAIF